MSKAKKPNRKIESDKETMSRHIRILKRAGGYTPKEAEDIVRCLSASPINAKKSKTAK